MQKALTGTGNGSWKREVIVIMNERNDFSEIIYRALLTLPRDAAPNHKRFMAVIQDLAEGYPSQKKILTHNSDDRYLLICSRAMQAEDAELAHISAEAADYLHKEFTTSQDRAEEISEDMVRAFAAVGRRTTPSKIVCIPVQMQAEDGSNNGQKKLDRATTENASIETVTINAETAEKVEVTTHRGIRPKRNILIIFVIVLVTLAIAGFCYMKFIGPSGGQQTDPTEPQEATDYNDIDDMINDLEE